MKKKAFFVAIATFLILFLLWPIKTITPTAYCNIDNPGYIVPELLECLPPEKIESFGGGLKFLDFCIFAIQDGKELHELELSNWERIWLDKDTSFNLQAALTISTLAGLIIGYSVYSISYKDMRRKR